MIEEECQLNDNKSSALQPPPNFIKFIQGSSDLHTKQEENPNSELNENEIGYRYSKRKNNHFDESCIKRHKKVESEIDEKIKKEIEFVVESGPFGKIVLFESALKQDNPMCILDRATSASHINSDYAYENDGENIICKIMLDNLYLATGKGGTKKLAKENASRVAVDRLKETSYTIQVKAAFSGSETIDRTLNASVIQNKGGSSQASDLNQCISDDNIGNKMLRLMGWAGGGLGKQEQGIEQPISVDNSNIRREGLGITSFFDFKKKMKDILKNYALSDSKEDLIFSPEFTKDERKSIHALVKNFELKSRSYGKEDASRHLVVFKKVKPLEIVRDLMLCDGETDKYKLISPNSLTE